jgi:hypothetical protein
MNILLTIILLGMSSWAFVALFRRLRHQQAGLRWWVALVLLIACGLAIGVWCAFYSEYQVGARFRFGSFPVPVVVFHLEEGNWVDFPLEAFVAWPVAIGNIITISALATLPLWLVSRRAKA